jgi:hypothetical protein
MLRLYKNLAIRMILDAAVYNVRSMEPLETRLP